MNESIEKPDQNESGFEKPEGFENLSLEYKKTWQEIEKIKPNFAEELKRKGVRIEVVDALMYLASYDEGEKVLKIRHDANVEFLNDYIENILKPDEQINELPDPGKLEDIHIEDGEEEGKEESGSEPNTGPSPESKEGETKIEYMPVPPPAPDAQPELAPNPPVSEPTSNPESQPESTPEEPPQLPVTSESTIPPLPGSSQSEPTESTPEPKVEGQNLPEWKNTEIWKKFEEARYKFAYNKAMLEYGRTSKGYFDVSNYDFENFENYIDLSAKNYKEWRKLVEEDIRKSISKTLGFDLENLTEDQKKELDQNTKIEVFSLLEDEYVERRKVLKKIKEKKGLQSLAEKALEKSKEVLNNKVAKWYISLSKKQRLALNFGIGSLVGLVAGAAGSIGVTSYIGWRAARVATSASASGFAGEWANKKWSIEELNKEEEKEIEELKNSDLGTDEMAKGYRDIKEKYKKERLKLNLKKIGTGAVAGLGAGLIVGAIENLSNSVDSVPNNNGPKNIIENKNAKTDNINNDRVKPREGFQPDERKGSPSVKSDEAEGGKENIKTKKLFSDPSILKHKVVSGDSVWGVLKDKLNQIDKFNNLTEAQKTFVLSSYTNEILKDPAKYGLAEDGSVFVGDELKLDDILNDEQNFETITKSASNNIQPNSPQESNILENNRKISEWVENNPNSNLSQTKIEEILDKNTDAVQSRDGTNLVPTEEEMSKILSDDEPSELDSGAKNNELQPEQIVPKSDPSKSYGYEDQKNTLESEIEDYKQRLNTLEGSEQSGQSITAIRSPYSDSQDAQLLNSVEMGKNDFVNKIYNESKFIGLFRNKGVNTNNWKFMKVLDANKVLNYFNDPNNTELPENVRQTLSTSEKHANLIKGILKVTSDINDKYNVDFKPFSNGENIEDYIKRIGTFLIKRADK